MRKFLWIGLFLPAVSFAGVSPYPTQVTTDVNNSPQAIIIPYAPNVGLVNELPSGAHVSFVPGVPLVQGVSGGTPIPVFTIPAAGSLDVKGKLADPTSDSLAQNLSEFVYLQNQENSMRNMLQAEQAASPNSGFELR